MFKRLIILGLLVGISGCTETSKPSNSPPIEKKIVDSRPLVVVTTDVLCDLTGQIADQTVNLQCLVSTGVDPHVYQPTPEDRKTIEKAQLIFYGGYNFDAKLIKLVKASSNNAPKIAVHEIAVKNPLQGVEEHDHQDDHDHNQDHALDPHVWHDPKNGIAMIKVIAGELAKLQPNQAQKYEQRANNITQEVKEIDQWIRSKIATIPKQRRKLVTTHDALGYYVKAYNLEFEGALLGLTTEAAPSANTIKELVKNIKKAQVTTIFAETSVNPQLIERVAKEANVKVSPYKLYADGLGEKGTEGDSYQKMLKANTRAIVSGLR
jgi:manganese/iron transport system substrate-binding protein